MKEWDVDPLEEEDSPLAKIELLIVMKREEIRKLQDKLRRKVTP